MMAVDGEILNRLDRLEDTLRGDIADLRDALTEEIATHERTLRRHEHILYGVIVAMAAMAGSSEQVATLAGHVLAIG